MEKLLENILRRDLIKDPGIELLLLVDMIMVPDSEVLLLLKVTMKKTEAIQMNMVERHVLGDLMNLVTDPDPGVQQDLMGQGQEDPHQEDMQELRGCKSLCRERGHLDQEAMGEVLDHLVVDLTNL